MPWCFFSVIIKWKQKNVPTDLKALVDNPYGPLLLQLYFMSAYFFKLKIWSGLVEDVEFLDTRLVCWVGSCTNELYAPSNAIGRWLIAAMEIVVEQIFLPSTITFFYNTTSFFLSGLLILHRTAVCSSPSSFDIANRTRPCMTATYSQDSLAYREHSNVLNNRPE